MWNSLGWWCENLNPPSVLLSHSFDLNLFQGKIIRIKWFLRLFSTLMFANLFKDKFWFWRYLAFSDYAFLDHWSVVVLIKCYLYIVGSYVIFTKGMAIMRDCDHLENRVFLLMIYCAFKLQKSGFPYCYYH